MGTNLIQTEQLPLLEALVLSMPGFFDLAGDRCHVPHWMTERIPSQVVGTGDGRSDPQYKDPRVDLSNTPTCFGSPAFDSPLPWQSHLGFKELSEILHYRFSDGRIVSVGEILT